MTYRPLENLDGQVAVITGAMGGIGYATAKRLAARGARILGIVRRDLDQAQDQLDQLSNPELEHLAILADVRDQQQIKLAIDQVISAAGKCNILVNTIGKTQRISHGDIGSLSDDLFDEIITDNLRCYYTVIREFVPLMQQTPEGLIINIGSTVVQNPGAGSNLAYCAAKAGIDSLTQNLSRALSPNIRVVGVSPGALPTKFVPGMPHDFYDAVAGITPLGRTTTPEDIAATIEGIATLLRYVTGNVITVDGGKTT